MIQSRRGHQVVGIFWDIENCPLPSNSNVSKCTSKLRAQINQWNPDLRSEDTRLCAVLNTAHYRDKTLESLQYSGVKLVHVAAQKVNAADGILMNELLEFKRSHPPPGSYLSTS